MLYRQMRHAVEPEVRALKARELAITLESVLDQASRRTT